MFTKHLSFSIHALKCICNEKLKKFFFDIWKEIGSIDLEKTFFVGKTALKVSKIA